MNLRVRSVTGCSLSAILASWMVLLARTLGIADLYASTDKESVLLDLRCSSRVE